VLALNQEDREAWGGGDHMEFKTVSVYHAIFTVSAVTMHIQVNGNGDSNGRVYAVMRIKLPTLQLKNIGTCRVRFVLP
jgi:hypothetical protein